jgi:hypothetical protein
VENDHPAPQLGYVAHLQDGYTWARSLIEEGLAIGWEVGNKPCIAIPPANLA